MPSPMIYSAMLMVIIPVSTAFVLRNELEILFSKVILLCLLIYLSNFVLKYYFFESHFGLRYLVTTPFILFFFFIVVAKPISENHLFLPKFLSWLGFALFVIGVIFLLTEGLTEKNLFPYTGDRSLVLPGVWMGIPGTRIGSIFRNSNQFGFVACFTTIASAYLIKKRYYFAKFLFLINFMALLLADKRSAILAFFISITILMFKKYSDLVVVTTIIFALVSFFVLINLYEHDLITRITNERTIIWRAHSDLYLKNIWFGLEFENMKQLIRNHPLPVWHGPHNGYLLALELSGLVGGVPYFVIIFYPFIKGIYYSPNSLNSDRDWLLYLKTNFLALVVILYFGGYSFGGLASDSTFLNTFLGLAYANAFSITPSND